MEDEDGCREGGGKRLVCVSVLRVCFLVSVLIVKGGMECTLVIVVVVSLLIQLNPRAQNVSRP